MKVLATIAKFIAKGAKAVIKKAPAIIKQANTFLTKHPKIAKALATYGATKLAAETIEGIISKFKETAGLEITQEEAKGISDLNSQLGSFDESKLSEYYHTDIRNPKKSNHPNWWFDPSYKINGSALYDRLRGVELLEKTVIRSLYFDFDPEKDGLNILPDTYGDELYAAYVNFYKALYMDPPQSKDNFITDMRKMLTYGFIILGQFFSLRRHENDRLAKVDGSYTLPRAVHGVSPFFGAEFANYGCINGLRPITQGQNGSTTTYGFAATTISNWNPQDVATIFNVGYTDVISNKKWAELVTQIKQLPVSQNLFDFAHYLFSNIFVDSMEEDLVEYYNFFPPAVNVFDFPRVTDGDSAIYSVPAVASMNASGSDTYYKLILDEVKSFNDLLVSDKAYVTLLALLGILPESYGVKGRKAPEWYSKFEGYFDRTFDSEEFPLVTVDDTFYNALANANYLVNLTYPNDIVLDMAASEYKNVMIKPEYSESNTVQLHYRKPVHKGINGELIPLPKELNAGEVASAVKFAGIFHLAIGPQMGYAILTPERVGIMPPVNVSIKMDVPEGLTSADFGIYNIGAIGATVGRVSNAPYASCLPCEKEVKWGNGLPGMFVDSGVHLSASGANNYKIVDIEIIKDYMWINAALSVQSIKDLQNILQNVKLVVGVEV